MCFRCLYLIFRSGVVGGGFSGGAHIIWQHFFSVVTRPSNVISLDAPWATHTAILLSPPLSPLFRPLSPCLSLSCGGAAPSERTQRVCVHVSAALQNTVNCVTTLLLSFTHLFYSCFFLSPTLVPFFKSTWKPHLDVKSSQGECVQPFYFL